MKYEISQEAATDTDGIYEYTLLEYGRTQADRYYDDLIARIALLAQSPQMARERTEFSRPVRIHPHGRHLIVYTIETDQIRIVRVLHQAMDIADHL